MVLSNENNEPYRTHVQGKEGVRWTWYRSWQEPLSLMQIALELRVNPSVQMTSLKCLYPEDRRPNLQPIMQKFRDWCCNYQLKSNFFNYINTVYVMSKHKNSVQSLSSNIIHSLLRLCKYGVCTYPLNNFIHFSYADFELHKPGSHKFDTRS